MFKRTCFYTAALLVLLGACAGYAVCDVPKLIGFQGRLGDSKGRAVTGTKTIVFKIYSSETLGSPLWTETQNVSLDTDGLYNVYLGAETALNLDFKDPYWLEVTVGDETLSPRYRLVPTAYSFYSINSGSATYALNAATAAYASSVDWSEISNRPSGLDDGDNIGTVGIGTIGSYHILAGTITVNELASNIDASGIGFNADKLDGYDAASFLMEVGSSTVGSYHIMPATITVNELSSDIDASAIGFDADKLDGYDASYFLLKASAMATGDMDLGGNSIENIYKVIASSMVFAPQIDGYKVMATTIGDIGQTVYYGDGSRLSGLVGGGNMVQATYDSDSNLIVDDSEKLSGKPYEHYVSTAGGQSIAGNKVFDSGYTVSFAGSLILPSANVSGAGTGSGLNADKLDGKDFEAFVSTTGDVMNGDLVVGNNSGTDLTINQDLLVGGTVTIGTDVNLYRSGVNLLKTDDSLDIVGALSVGSGEFDVDSSGNITDVGNIATDSNITIGASGYGVTFSSGITVNSTSTVTGNLTVNGIMYGNGAGLVNVPGTSITKTLDNAFDDGKAIDGANNSSNAVQVGNGTDDLLLYTNVAMPTIATDGTSDLTIAPDGGDTSITGNLYVSGNLADVGNIVTDSNITIGASGYGVTFSSGITVNSTSTVTGNLTVNGIMYGNGAGLVNVPGTSITKTLDNAFDDGKTIDGASSAVNALQIGDGTDDVLIYTNSSVPTIATDGTSDLTIAPDGGDTSISGNLSVSGNLSSVRDIVTLTNINIGAAAYNVTFASVAIVSDSLGIGTGGVPRSLLEIAGSSAQMDLDATSGNPIYHLCENGTRQFDMGYHTSSDYFFIAEPGIAEHFVVKDGGRVGVGTNVPDSKFEVKNGSITITGTDANLNVEDDTVLNNLTVNGTITLASQTRYFSIPGSAVDGASTNVLISTDGYAHNNTASMTRAGAAPVLLPDGAVVTSFKGTTMVPNSGGGSPRLDVELIKVANTGALTVMANVSDTAMDDTIGTAEDTTITSATIDNSANFYELSVVIKNGDTSKPRFYGAIITYTVTKPLP